MAVPVSEPVICVRCRRLIKLGEGRYLVHFGETGPFCIPCVIEREKAKLADPGSTKSE